MESKSSFRKQIWWALAIIVAFTAYHFYTRGGPGNVDIAAVQQDMEGLWSRVPDYTGAGKPTEQVSSAPTRVIIERSYPGTFDYAAVSAFYKKELPAEGWQYVGEQEKLPGFATPIQVFHTSDYHLLVYLTENSLRLRLTFSLDRTPLVDPPKS